MSETATATKRRGRPRKPQVPDLPTVATHGTTIDHSQVLDALGAIPQFPVPPMDVVMQWSQQVRAEVLRWANHTQRDTEPLPAVLDAWLTQHGKIIPMPVESTEELQFSEETQQTVGEQQSDDKPDQQTEGWLLEDRPWTKGAKEINNLTVPIQPDRAVELMNEQAEAYRELSRLKNEKKAVDSDLNAKIKKTETKLSELTDAVLHGQETSSVECQWEYDYTNGVKRLIRLDTGVIVEHGTLNEKERQMRLQLEENTHSLDAEAQPESERDRLIAECVRKAHEMRPVLKVICDDKRMRYGLIPERPDGWPYNPSAAVLSMWWDDSELKEFAQMLDTVAAAHSDGKAARWDDYLPSGDDGMVGDAEARLNDYWRDADNDGVMPNVDDSIENDPSYADADQEIKDLYLTLHQRGNGDSPKWAEVNAWPVGVVEEVQNWLTYGKGDVPEVLKSYVWAANKPEEAVVTQQEAANTPEEVTSEPEAEEELNHA